MTGARTQSNQALQLGLGPCRRLSAWLVPAPWEGVNSGGHGRIVMEFGSDLFDSSDQILFQVENSRVCRVERPRWTIVGTLGSFVKRGVDPQEDALRGGNIDAAFEPAEHRAMITSDGEKNALVEAHFPTVRGHWDSYYRNIADHLLDQAPLIVTAEAAREVVRVLDAAVHSAETHSPVTGPWGN